MLIMKTITLLETNSLHFASENGWLEDDRFFLGFGLFAERFG